MFWEMGCCKAVQIPQRNLASDLGTVRSRVKARSAVTY